jgi:hypothetical protein
VSPDPSKDSDIANVEITSDMIEAGRLELAHYNPRQEDAEPVVRAIFEAMIAASHQSAKASNANASQEHIPK